MMSFLFITDDVGLNHLIKMMSICFLQCEEEFIICVINKCSVKYLDVF